MCQYGSFFACDKTFELATQCNDCNKWKWYDCQTKAKETSSSSSSSINIPVEGVTRARIESITWNPFMVELSWERDRDEEERVAHEIWNETESSEKCFQLEPHQFEIATSQ